jgi:hypothetical protein
METRRGSGKGGVRHNGQLESFSIMSSPIFFLALSCIFPDGMNAVMAPTLDHFLLVNVRYHTVDGI